MKRNAFVLIAPVCTLLFSCSKMQFPEGDGTDCISFQKEANTIEDMVVGQYNSVQSVFYHVGGWEWSCCFNTRSGLKEGDSLKVCGYVVKKIPKSHNSDYYIKFCTKDDEQYEKMALDFQNRILYKICDKKEDYAPYIIMGIDTTRICLDIMKIVIAEKSKTLYFNGQCYLLYVGDSLFDNKDVSPGYNMSLARFAVPYILVSDSNDIIIRKEE
ncbi:MAG: hypothetical protein J6S82_02770 [Bacteroidales bacterium]|nr:hypothetical protein [Bacteroidales bacterium]